MTRPAWILAVFLLLASPTLAAADQPDSSDSPDTGGLFIQLDGNNDGLLTTDEIPDDRRSLWRRLMRIADSDDDGKLTALEFAAGLSDGSQRGGAPSQPSQPSRPGRADRERGGAGKLFERFDANGDGKVEIDEVPEPARERIGKLIERVDKDGDGAVTRREMARAAARPDAQNRDRREPRQLFQRMDRNADGKVSVDEVPEQHRRRLAQLIRRGDKDGDESLSLKEFIAAHGNRGPGQSPAKAGPPRGPDTRKPSGLFGAIDANRDGQLDRQEIAAAADAIGKLDKNGDGQVSAREAIVGAARKGKKGNPKNKQNKNRKKKKKQQV